MRIITLTLLTVLLTISCSKSLNKEEEARTTVDLSKSVADKEIWLHVKKGKRELVVYQGKKPIKKMKISIGRGDSSKKERVSDLKTPEGDYYICELRKSKSFYKSILISYPNDKDAESGLKRNLINDNEYKRIVFAIKNYETPPQDTMLGGQICIHGGGVWFWNWTQGCIAIENTDIDYLFSICNKKNRVVIIH